MEIVERPSPNHGDRKGARPSIVVIHYTAMESAEAALERLCDPAHQVSAHWLIGRDGVVYRLVDEARRAWHAGAGRWGAVEDVNSHSIGIELDHPGEGPYPDVQMRALLELLRGVRGRWGIAKENVIGHSCMSPGRKSDPGPAFDWGWLERAGFAVWPPEGAVDGEWADFRAAARAAGWTAEVDDALLLDAVRLRHRPEARGRPLEPRDIFLVRWRADRDARRGPEEIAGTYRRQATAFDARRGRSGVEAGWLGRFLDLAPAGPLLDLGCGAGEPVAAWLVGTGRRVTGVDISPELLAIARGRMPDQDWREGDMRALDLGRRFAGIVAWNSFFHLDPAAQTAMFPRFAAHAERGAPLLFTSGPAAGEAWGRVGEEEVYHASLAPEAYRAHLDAAGFDVVDFVPEDPDCDRHSVWLARRR